jgi:ATP-dependent RNA/DNA helicase IGHMBP2
MDLGLEGDERVESFIKRQKELLDLEKVAHTKRDIQELREHGDTIWVELVSTCEPKYGGTIVKFKPRQTKNSKKAPTFRSGCMVGVDFGSEMLHGILVSVKVATFEVHVKDSSAIFSARKFYELVKISEEGTFEQLELALDGISHNKFNLRDILFGLVQPSSPMTKFYEKHEKLDFLNKSLDCSQREAVEFALKQKELAVVHGPPGTGKTTTVVEIICQVRLCKLIYISNLMI